MAELKTQQTEADVYEFLNSYVESEKKKQDSIQLINLMSEYSGFPPKMWGTSIIGFGKYHYKSERSKQEGDWPLVGFSPRKSAISLYVYTCNKEQDEWLNELGKYKMGASCIYVKKLEDIDLEVLKKIMGSTIEFLNKKYG